MARQLDDRLSYRLEILNLLGKRERQQKGVKAMFHNYAMLEDQLQRVQRARSVSTNSEPVGSASDRLASMKEEMASVYRMKSKNDQDLIDANRKLADTEARYSHVLSQRDKLRIETDKLITRLNALEVFTCFLKKK